MTPLERAILNRIQASFPLVPHPYTELARILGSTPDAVRAAIASCREQSIIRRIGGSFEAARLGYVSALVAARVEPSHLEHAANSAAHFDEVTHDYERDAGFNLWFTVVAESAQRMNEITDTVAACPGVSALHVLPALKTFKLRVNFNMEAAVSAVNPEPCHRRGRRPPVIESRSDAQRPAVELDDTDRRLIARCCHDLDDGEQPFQDMAADVGITDGDLLDRLQHYRESGIMRRFGAMIRHQQAGFTANAMGVWDVPSDDVERVGSILAAGDAVSHCYERPRFAEWPFNLYSMIHGRSEDACRQTAAALAEETGIAANRLLFTGREFKKSSVRYFTRYWFRQA